MASLVDKKHEFCLTESQGYIFSQGHAFVQDKDSGQSHEVLKIMLAKIMVWLWHGYGMAMV